MNDNSPKIVIEPGLESVTENNANIGDTVLQVKVSDVDQGANGEVNLSFSCAYNCSCELSNCKDNFELIEFVSTAYKLILVKPLDFEISNIVSITFAATDNGETANVNSEQVC